MSALERELTNYLYEDSHTTLGVNSPDFDETALKPPSVVTLLLDIKPDVPLTQAALEQLHSLPQMISFIHEYTALDVEKGLPEDKARQHVGRMMLRLAKQDGAETLARWQKAVRGSAILTTGF